MFVLIFLRKPRKSW